VELAARWEADAELEALWSLAARVRDMVLGGADGPSSLATSMSSAAELLESWINAIATNGSVGGPFYLGCHRIAFP
jgi:hypothetical protein